MRKPQYQYDMKHIKKASIQKKENAQLHGIGFNNILLQNVNANCETLGKRLP